MKENIAMFKKWWLFAKPDKKYLTISFLSAFFHRVCLLLAPIFAAKVIANLTVQKFDSALLYLTIGALIMVLRNIIIHFKYMVHSKLLASTYIRFQKVIANKIFNANTSNFRNTSKEKLINIFHSDVHTVANFSDILTNKLAQFSQLIVISVTLIIINLPVGIIVTLINILNVFIINFLQARFARGTKKIRECHDRQYNEFSHLFDAKDYVKDDKMKARIEKDFIGAGNKFIEQFHKRQKWNSAIANWYYVWCHLIVFVMTIVMIFLLSKGNLTLELYLIVVPYLTSYMDVSIEFFNVFVELKNTNVALNRVKIITEFSEKEIVEFGETEQDNILGTIDFVNICYEKKNKNDAYSKLNDISFHIRENETTLIHGEKYCGKRTIFELIMRNIEPTSGDIYVDGLSIKDYSKRTHSQNIKFVSSKPYFMNGSVMKNLRMITGKTDRIYDVCKDIGIYDSIMALKNRFNTQASELNTKLKYLTSLAMALLSDPSVIMFYETPNSLADNEFGDILDAIKHLHGNKTMVIFSAKLTCAQFCDKIIDISNGEIVNIQFNKSDN